MVYSLDNSALTYAELDNNLINKIRCELNYNSSEWSIADHKLVEVYGNSGHSAFMCGANPELVIFLGNAQRLNYGNAYNQKLLS